MTDITTTDNRIESPLDEHALRVLHGLRREHPESGEKIDFVISRLQNLQADPVDNLQEYYTVPRGSLLSVIRNMQASGATAKEIGRQLGAYQKWITSAIDTAKKSKDTHKRLSYLIYR